MNISQDDLQLQVPGCGGAGTVAGVLPAEMPSVFATEETECGPFTELLVQNCQCEHHRTLDGSD